MKYQYFHFSDFSIFSIDLGSRLNLIVGSLFMNFHVFSPLIFASIFACIFNGKWSQNGPSWSLGGPPFWHPFSDIDFCMHFYRPLAHLWHPFGSILVAGGRFWCPLGSIVDPLDAFGLHFGSPWCHLCSKIMFFGTRLRKSPADSRLHP